MRVENSLSILVPANVIGHARSTSPPGRISLIFRCSHSPDSLDLEAAPRSCGCDARVAVLFVCFFFFFFLSSFTVFAHSRSDPARFIWRNGSWRSSIVSLAAKTRSRARDPGRGCGRRCGITASTGRNSQRTTSVSVRSASIPPSRAAACSP